MKYDEAAPQDETAAADSASPSPAVEPTQTHLDTEWKLERPLIACRFDPTGQYVFATAEDNSIQRWQLSTGERITLAGHDSWVRGLAFHEASGLMLSAGFDGRLIWWDYAHEAPTPLRSIEAHAGWARDVDVSPDGRIVASGGNDQLVKLFSREDGSLLRELPGHESHVYAARFHPSGALISGDLKGVLRQWDVETGEQTRELDASKLWKYDGGFRADIGGIRTMAYSADGSLFAVGGITDVTNAFAGVGKVLVLVFDWESGEIKAECRSKEGVQGVAWGVAFHGQGFVATCSGGQGGGNLFFWKSDSGEELHRMKLKHTARDLALHPDGLRLAVAHYDSHLRIYNMAPESAEEKPA